MLLAISFFALSLIFLLACLLQPNEARPLPTCDVMCDVTGRDLGSICALPIGVGMDRCSLLGSVLFCSVFLSVSFFVSLLRSRP